MKKSKNRSAHIRKFIDEHPELTQDKERARVYWAENPDEFDSLEQARGAIRYVTGKAGDRKRKCIGEGELTKYFFKEEFKQWAEEKLNHDHRPWDDPFIIPKSIRQLNIIADLHSVHLNPQVLSAFLKASDNKEALLIDGDLMDSESLSRHLKGHNLIEYDKELELCHQILKGLKQEFDHVYFKAGNHDFWLERYLLSNAREIFRLRGIELSELLRLGELGVHYIHNLKYINYGDLDIVHGHEFSSAYGQGKFPATGYVDKWQTFKGQYDVKILAGHCHRHDHHISKKSKDGKFGEGWVIPAMCRKGAAFNPYAGWDNGWAVANINNDCQTEVKITVL